MSTSYGTSEQYLGVKGQHYFAWQDGALRELAGMIAQKYLPFVGQYDTVLDFGCGGGSILSVLPGARKLGVEVNPVALATAVERGIECFPALDDVPNGIADVAISNHALEHVPYPIEALTQLRMKLRPGGRLVLCLPLDDWRTQRVYSSEDIHHHLYTWTPQLLGNTLTEAGFEVKASDISLVLYAVHPVVRWVPRVFHNWFCKALAIVLKRRQLLAVVTR